MEFEQVESIFRGAILGRANQGEYHCIVADHPYMSEIGLGVFTTGELYEWMSKTDSNGQFVNLKLIGANYSPLNPNEDLMDRFSSATEILFHNNASYTTNYYFSAWRNVDRGGLYKKFTGNKPIGNWDFQDENGKSYRNALINYDLANLAVSYDPSLNPPIKYTETKTLDQKICQIIAMNDFARIVDYFTDEPWYNDTSRAASEFITDIKSSYEKCLTWSGVVNFNLNLGVETSNGACVKPEIVTYKLYLYDEDVSRDDSRRVTVNNVTIVGPKSDAFGRLGNVENGKVLPPSISPDPSNSVASNLDIKWVENGGKWEAGTPQVLAQLVTDIPAAKTVDLSDNLTKTTDELLDPSRQIQPGTGIAMPIVMQNGNPKQYSPNYKKTENCRSQDEAEKFTVTAYNHAPRIWKSGEMVMLNRIDNAWVISVLYNEPVEQPIESTFDGKWDFMYLMTNSDHYFRQTDGFFIDCNQYEDAVRSKYYEGDDLNKFDSGYDVTKISNSYFQVTSWDFMGPNIGGLNTKNYLSGTQFSYDFNKQVFDNAGKFNEAIKTAPFFGCVFPNGYQTNGKYDKYKNGEHNLAVAQGNSTFFVVPPSGNIFDNNNGILNTVSSGMFFLDDSSLPHLPADIALNASPVGINGSPLKNVADFKWFGSGNMENNLRNNFFVKKSTGFQSRYNWIHNKENPPQSAFDFSPVTSRVISFRPLKAEVYAAFERTDPDADANFGKGEFGKKLREQLTGSNDNDIISLDAYGRNLNNPVDGKNKLYGDAEYFSLYEESFQGLKYNKTVDYPDRIPAEANFPRPFWDQEWMIEPNKPAGAVGIIGAQCTVTADNRINFTTKNYLGMGSWFINGRWYPSWGAYGGGSYFSLNTTSLHVRVFQAWPRDLTVYDPRFFAVHHFNPGVDLSTTMPPSKDHYFNGELLSSGEIPNNFPWDQNELYPTGYYSVDKPGSEVDIRVPTSYEGAKLGEGPIYKNTPSVREDKNTWRIETHRRGKLLPYKYKARVIGVGDYKIFSGGIGYKDGDTFKISGGSGNGVVLIPIISSAAGIITGFQIPDAGKDFLPQDFLDFNVDLLDSINPDDIIVRIVEDKVSGSGFLGGFYSGKMYEATLEDEKPKEAGDQLILKLTPDAVTAPQDAIAGANGILDQTFDTELNLVNKSSNNKYDLFFHFHNDISHTFVFPDWGATTVPVEQEVRLEITLN